MTEATHTQILLPTAGVDLFLKDGATSEAAKALSEDWRFARVNVSVHDGDVETAINMYGQSASPTLVIIETNTTDESFIERLGALAGNCAEGTNAIIIGPVNDVNLYRSLTSMGVQDYLVKPVAQDVLGEVIASTLIENLGTTDSRLISVIGAKGGVGTSAIAQAVALACTEKRKQKTFLMDAAGGWSSLSVSFAFEPGGSQNEAVRAAAMADEDTLSRMINKKTERLHILATGAEPLLDATVQAQQYEALLDSMMAAYPVVVADLSSSVPSLKRTVLNKTHKTFVVTTPALSSLRSARTLISEIKTLHGGADSGIELVVNMQGFAAGREVPRGDISTAMDREASVFVPFNSGMFIGLEADGRPMSEDKAGMEIIDSLVPLISDIIEGQSGEEEEPVKKSGGLLGGLLGKK